MEKMKIRKMTNNDIGEAAELLKRSLAGYPLFEAAKQDFADDKEFADFFAEYMTVFLKATLRANRCFVLADEKQISAVVVLRSPKDKEIGVSDYIKAGGFEVIRRQGIKNTFEYLGFIDEAEDELKKLDGKQWHMVMIAVADGLKGRGLGSDILKKFVYPYAQKRSCDVLTLTVNTDKGADFFNKNGFEEYSRTRIKYKDSELFNWCFVKRFDTDEKDG